jgi:hypothetical protein
VLLAEILVIFLSGGASLRHELDLDGLALSAFHVTTLVPARTLAYFADHITPLDIAGSPPEVALRHATTSSKKTCAAL